MTYKKINLFLIAVAIVFMFFRIQVYNDWVNTKILGDNIFELMDHMKISERQVSRYGYSYIVYQNIANKITDPKTAIILLPPNEYLKTLKVREYTTPEPATFYYYTGLTAVWANSPNVEQANWELVVRSDQQIGIKKITDKKHLDSVIAFYRKFDEP